MLVHVALCKISELMVPSGIHPILHVDTRKAWIDAVESMIERGAFTPSRANVVKLAQNWESVLYAKFSSLN